LERYLSRAISRELSRAIPLQGDIFLEQLKESEPIYGSTSYGPINYGPKDIWVQQRNMNPKRVHVRHMLHEIFLEKYFIQH
jgi:hypothetical protein